MLKLCILLLCVSSVALAKIPDADLFNNPALLIDYQRWIQENNQFTAPGTDRRLFVDLVKIAYDWDLQRPWGDAFFPEATKRLKAFQAQVCDVTLKQDVCKLGSLTKAEDVPVLQAALRSVDLRKELGKRWGIRIIAWCLPLHDCGFSFLAGVDGGQETLSASFWKLKADPLALHRLEFELVPDRDNYRAGFDSKEVPALLAQSDGGAFVNEWQTKQRAITLATTWKNAVSHPRSSMDPIIDAVEVQFQRMSEEQRSVFEKTYSDLRKAVEGHPTLVQRFEAEKAAHQYPDEVYQSIVHGEFMDILRIEAGYFHLATKQRVLTSERQKAMESLLTLQRYTQSPSMFAMELTTLLDPFSSHASVLDQNADFGLAATYVTENLNAILGLDIYAGAPLFPHIGAGLKNAALFNETILKNQAPEVLVKLAGRDFVSLEVAEQLNILRLYLAPSGKSKTMALMRMGTLFLSTASAAELRELAGVIHVARSFDGRLN